MLFLNQLFGSRFWALVRKEISQILRDKQLIILLVVTPTIQLLVYGFALNPDVNHLKLGVVDYAQTSESRELVAALVKNQVFDVEAMLFSETALAKQVETGDISVGIVIPPDFSRKLNTGKSTDIQVIIDGVDANTAGIASSYTSQIVRQFGQQYLQPTLSSPIITQVIFLYNQGLISSWFFTPGVMGIVLTLLSTIISSITVIREKDTGTLEQMLMTPAEPSEILLAKIFPLFGLLMGDVLLALTISKFIFDVPFQGSFLLLMVLSGLYLLVGIGIGITLATVCQSQQQVVLISFFVNMPMVQLSGAIAPIETMPSFLKALSLLNPLRHYIAIVRGIMLKGVGMEALWFHALSLVCFVVVLLSISINRFRKQVG
jgi:ABC-2 type transport system permease protein